MCLHNSPMGTKKKIEEKMSWEKMAESGFNLPSILRTTSMNYDTTSFPSSLSHIWTHSHIHTDIHFILLKPQDWEGGGFKVRGRIKVKVLGPSN